MNIVAILAITIIKIIFVIGRVEVEVVEVEIWTIIFIGPIVTTLIVVHIEMEK